MEDESGHVKESAPKNIVTANDVMFIADHDKYYNKPIGIILNVECEITSTLNIDCDKFVKYDNEQTEMKPYYAGNFDSDKTLEACAKKGTIVCGVKDETKYLYEGNGDSQIIKELQKRVEKATIITDNKEVPLDEAIINYTKIGTTY